MPFDVEELRGKEHRGMFDAAERDERVEREKDRIAWNLPAPPGVRIGDPGQEPPKPTPPTEQEPEEAADARLAQVA